MFVKGFYRDEVGVVVLDWLYVLYYGGDICVVD